MSSEQFVIECSHVAVAPSGCATAILSDFSMSVARGEIVVLLGGAGAGKSAVLRLINGLTMPDAGDVWIEGHLTTEWDLIEMRRQIGTVLQNDGLFPHFSVARNIGLVPELLDWPREEIARRVIELLETVNLPPEEFAHLSPAQLSDGQRRRVSFARALAADPEIVLLDEPFARLDPLAREQMRDEFVRLCRELGKTAIFATQDLREAFLLADKIALLREGNLAFFGTPEQFALTDNSDARAYRATMDLPAWMITADPPQTLAPALVLPATNEKLPGDVAAIKEPGLRAKLKRAGKRWKSGRL